MSRSALLAVVFSTALLLSGCAATTAPAAAKAPVGFSAGDEFSDGAWVKPPVKDDSACDVAPVDAYCWRAEAFKVGAKCPAGFAFTWEADDAYGDSVLNGRARVLMLEPGEVVPIGFRVLHGVETHSVKITSAGCI